MERILHPFPPVYGNNSRTLLLGTMASPQSRARGFYYMHPQNRFWPVLAAVFGAPVPASDGARRALLLDNGLALWDVLAACDIRGASDASIREPVANDVAGLIRTAGVTRVFATGQTAARLYRTLIEPDAGIACRTLPSPSPANCRVPFAALVEAYRALLPE